MTLGANLGGQQMQGGTAAGNFMMQGAQNAGNAMQGAGGSALGTGLTALGNNKDFTTGVANWMNPYGGTPQGAYGQQSQYMTGALGNPQTQQAQMLADQQSWFK